METGGPAGGNRQVQGACRPCTNCKAVFAGQWCPHCGERRLDGRDYRLVSLLGEWLGTLLNADSRTRASARDLLWRPGELSAAWFEGRRQRYLRIVQVFILANLYYLIHASFVSPAGLYTPLWGHTNPEMSPLHHGVASEWIAAWLAEEGRDWDSLSTAFDQRVRLLGNTLIFLLAPLTALPMAVLLWRLRRSLAEHLVFCLHLWAFLIIVVTTVGFVAHALVALWTRLVPEPSDVADILGYRLLAESVVIYLALLWYSWFGVHRYYRLTGFWRVVWLLLTVVLATLALVSYRAILFFLTWFMVT